MGLLYNEGQRNCLALSFTFLFGKQNKEFFSFPKILEKVDRIFTKPVL